MKKLLIGPDWYQTNKKGENPAYSPSYIVVDENDLILQDSFNTYVEAIDFCKETYGKFNEDWEIVDLRGKTNAP